MIDFMVLSLPRSGSTWVANWLTTDRSLCLHDPFADSLPPWPKYGRTLGISCTGSYLMPEFLRRQDCPIAVIERDPGDCDASLKTLGAPPITAHMKRMLEQVNGRRWSFADLWNETKAREMWAFLLPEIAFDAPRYRLLGAMQIQPRVGKVTYDVGVLKQLQPLLEV